MPQPLLVIKPDPDAPVNIPAHPPPDYLEALKLLRVAGLKLQAERTTVVTAYIFFHRYIHHMKNDCQRYPAILLMQDVVAATCYSLARKVSDDPNFNGNDITNVFYGMCNPGGQPLDPQQPQFTRLQDSIAEFEIELLRTIRFNLRFDIPHFYLYNYLKCLVSESSESKEKNAQFCETAVTILDDFYLNPKCLFYDAEDIAISVIRVMLEIWPIVLKPGPRSNPDDWARYFSGGEDKFARYDEIGKQLLVTYSFV